MALLSYGGFDPSGILVLFGGIGAACLLFLAQQNKADSSAQKTEKKIKSPKTEEQIIRANSSGGVPVAAKISREVRLTGVDEKTAAMLIAIVCEASEEDFRALRFVSITAQNTEKG